MVVEFLGYLMNYYMWMKTFEFLMLSQEQVLYHYTSLVVRVIIGVDISKEILNEARRKVIDEVLELVMQRKLSGILSR